MLIIYNNGLITDKQKAKIIKTAKVYYNVYHLVGDVLCWISRPVTEMKRKLSAYCQELI